MIPLEKENYSTASSQNILDENQEEFKEIELLEIEINTLKNELIDSETTKETEKIKEKIKVIEEKKAKKEIELAVVVQQVNTKEIESAKQKLDRLKPIEIRSLHKDTSPIIQGQLHLWLEIRPEAEAHREPPVELHGPKKQKFDLRIVCWKSRDVPFDMGDYFAEFWIGDSRKQ